MTDLQKITDWGWCGGHPCEGDHRYGPDLRMLCMGSPWRSMRQPNMRALFVKWLWRTR